MQRFLDNPKLLLIVTGIVAIVLIALTLFPEKVTNVFNLIPATDIKQQSTTAIPTTISQSPIEVNCPVSQILCPEGKKQEFTPLGRSTPVRVATWRLPEFSPLYAAFDGTAKEEIRPLTGTTSLSLITLTSTNGKYLAEYRFETLSTTAQEVATREIGTVEKGTIIGVVPGTSGGAENSPNFFFGISFADNGVMIDLPAENVGGMLLP